MASPTYTTPATAVNDFTLGGGLNSTSGPLQLQNNESSDLQNIDFDKFGAVIKRNGYTALNTSAIASSPTFDGIWWYEYNNAGTPTRYLVATVGTNFYKMDDLDGTWDSITGALTITAGNHCDFENFLNEVYVTNGTNPPWKWTGSGNASAMTVPTGLTKAKYVKQYNNYLFLANVTVSGTSYPSRIYWSNLKTTSTWTSTDFIEISKDDGQQITGIKVLNDRLVIFKERAIYNLFFTGDADIPFFLPGGGKSNSAVGCIAPFSIVEAENGLVFLSHDGFYFYDGNNAYKISDRVTETLLGFNTARFNDCVATVQKNKNRIFFAMCGPSASTHNRVLVWDYFLNAWSLYTGMAIASIATIYVSGIEERVYWGDYAGFAYRADTGTNDYPLNVATAIDAYYYTNWRHYGDLINQKGVAECVVYYKISNAVLTFAYSYDFEDTDQYSTTFSTSVSGDSYGTAIYGTATYSGTGGFYKRRDLTGRGRVVRFKIANSTLSETFRIEGLGQFAYNETNV